MDVILNKVLVMKQIGCALTRTPTEQMVCCFAVNRAAASYHENQSKQYSISGILKDLYAVSLPVDRSIKNENVYGISTSTLINMKSEQLETVSANRTIQELGPSKYLVALTSAGIRSAGSVEVCKNI